MPTGDVAGRCSAASAVARAGLSLARSGTPPCGRRPASEEDRRRVHLGVGANADTGQTSTRGSACFKSQDGTAALLGLEGLWILGCGGRICRLCTGPHSTAHAKNHYRSISRENSTERSILSSDSESTRKIDSRKDVPRSVWSSYPPLYPRHSVTLFGLFFQL